MEYAKSRIVMLEAPTQFSVRVTLIPVKIRSLFCLLLLVVHISSCSKPVEKNGTSPASLATPANRSAGTASNRSTETVESKSLSSTPEAVSFDGTNFIKKSGWLTPPPHSDSYVDDTLGEDAVKHKTQNGKTVTVVTLHFNIYQVPWIHSEDFTFDGQGLDYLKGKIESDYYGESRVKGKTFMYSIPGKKVTGLPANAEPHEDPFMYQLQDRNGDGIFETLLSGGQDIVVPNWVLK